MKISRLVGAFLLSVAACQPRTSSQTVHACKEPRAKTDPATAAEDFNQAVTRSEVTSLSTQWQEEAEQTLKERLDQSHVFLLGERHGVAENPSIIYTVMRRFGFRSLALEWDEKLMPVVEEFLDSGSVPFEAISDSLDGRITAGHFALLRKLRDEGRLDPLILFDGRFEVRQAPSSDSKLPPGQNERDEAMAKRFLAKRNPGRTTLVIAGNVHTRTKPFDLRGGTVIPMGSHVTKAVGNVPSGDIDYLSGCSYSVPRGEEPGVQEISKRPFDRIPERNQFLESDGKWTFKLIEATPGIIPGALAGARPHSGRRPLVQLQLN